MAAYGLQKAYGSCMALDGASMMVRRGDIYGLVGRNGAGKTTLKLMINGQSAPTGGELV
ncbi:MAG: ATP-binding cassette domain-containing protein, partial [Oscillospiraceae bacterium]